MDWAKRSLGLLCVALSAPTSLAHPSITLAPAGPYRVAGPRLLDRQDRHYLIRGTRLPPLPLTPSPSPGEFSPFSGTTLVTLRQRLNLNAVRLPIHATLYETNAAYRQLVQDTVARFHTFELLAILEPAETPAPSSFWALCAGHFRDDPHVVFAVGAQSAAVASVRQAGASQPILLSPDSPPVSDAQLVYELRPSYATLAADRTRLTLLAAQHPVLVDGLDPDFAHDGPECAAVPPDPEQAAELLAQLLRFFDDHHLSWTISTLDRGFLIDHFGGYNWSKLDPGWTCGQPAANSGIGLSLLSHLWDANPLGVFTVNQPGGGLVIARGANFSTYGRILAEQELTAHGTPRPTRLGNISLRVTDSRGVARLAPLFWTGAGWASVNGLIPPDSALGPAEVAVLRTDGSLSRSRIFITDVAPALWTLPADGRGPAIAQVHQRFSDGHTARLPAGACTKAGCRTLPIPLTPQAVTTLRLEGSGFRFTSAKTALHVTVDGLTVPVESYGPLPEDGRDQVTVRLPDSLIGRGEVEVFLTAHGVLSNVVQIYCGRHD